MTLKTLDLIYAQLSAQIHSQRTPTGRQLAGEERGSEAA